MIGEYLREILQVQSQGPYIVCGHNVGAYIAYELVRLLEDLGKEVKQLVILDNPMTFGFLTRKRMRFGRIGRTEDPYLKFAKTAQHLMMADIGSQRHSVDTEQPGVDVAANITRLIHHSYQPKAMVRSAIKVLSAIDNPEQGKTRADWQKVTLGEVSFREVPGTHQSMFYPPNVGAVHKALVET